MKSKFVILLSLVILNSYAQGQHGNLFETQIFGQPDTGELPGFVLDFIEGLINQGLQLANNILEQFNRFAGRALALIEQIAATAREGLESIISAIQKELEAMQQQNENVQSCIDQFMPEIQAVHAQAREEVKNCTDVAANYINSIRDKIENQTNAIRQEVESLRQVAEECLVGTTIVTAIQCVLTRGQEISTSIASIAANAFQALRIASREFITISLGARQCIKGALASAEQQHAEILGKIQQCINSTSS